jgi:hypothetical protein
MVSGPFDFGSGGSIFEWELDPSANASGSGRGVGYDAMNASSFTGSNAVFQIILTGGQTFAAPFWDSNQTWANIFSPGAALATIFNGGFGGNVPVSGIVAGRGSFSFSSSSLEWSAVPEPSSALAGILLALGLLRRRRAS